VSCAHVISSCSQGRRSPDAEREVEKSRILPKRSAPPSAQTC
jgi:hypothetical protein